MSPTLAAFCCGLFILLLLRWEAKRRPASFALWIPLVWALILGSKPVSAWFGFGNTEVGSDGYVEGTPFDRLVLFFLIASALVVVARRNVNWSRFFSNNRWLFIYFAYLGASVLWSDYTFVASKRWIKDLGNVLMVLVVLTEKEPLVAVKTLLLRCTYVLIPLSVVLVKYYPELGRYYDKWTYQPYFCGASTDKNLLGMSLFFCGLPLLWQVMEARARKDNRAFYIFLLLAVMLGWLLAKTGSSTARSCTIIGAGILIAMSFRACRNRANFFGAYAIGFVMLLVVLNMTFDLGGVLLRLVGRDPTLTGRTEIWRALLQEPINPLFGDGFYSFWLGDRIEKLSRKYYYMLNEAHNGYLETYLNSGLIGVTLLLALLFSSAKRIGQEVRSGSGHAVLGLAFLVGTITYGMTEAVFRFGPIWFGLLLVLTQSPCRGRSATTYDERFNKRAERGFPSVPALRRRAVV